MSPGVASPEEVRAGWPGRLSARTSLRPVDGAGTWRHTTPHRTLRLTYLGTVVLTAVLTLTFLTAVHLGRQLVCRMDVAAVGHPSHTYCPGWKSAPRTDAP